MSEVEIIGASSVMSLITNFHLLVGKLCEFALFLAMPEIRAE